MTDTKNNEKIIVIMRGVPGSGKSTKARSLAPAENIFSTDEYWMVNGEYKFDASRLGEAHRWNESRANDAMNKGVIPIVIDNTNIKIKAFQSYIDMASKHGYDVKIEMPDTPWWIDIYPKIKSKKFTDVDVSIFVNKTVHGVPHASVKTMMIGWEEYTVQVTPKNITGDSLIFDIDGTLALMTGRSPYDLSRVHEDALCIPVYNVLRAFENMGYKILIVSGREGTVECRQKTEEWLKANNVPHDALWMRNAGDMRNDAIVKNEIYDNHIKGRYVVEFVMDDRNRVCDLWRSIGLKCFQVAPGDF